MITESRISFILSIVMKYKLKGTDVYMKFLGNLIWFIFGGFINFITWGFIGLLWCMTIIGIPVGIQCFKIARLSAWPMGREVYHSNSGGSFIMNILWLIFGGIEIAAMHLFSGLILCVTIIGIPFGLQQFKLVKLALFPFGAEIHNERQQVVMRTEVPYSN